MKIVLFIEKDKDICDFISEYIQLNIAEYYHARIASNLEEADEILRRETFDGVVLDALEPSAYTILDFVRKARHRDYRLPILALVGYHDMILNPALKENLQKSRVSIADKVNALKEENIFKLFENACNRGFGEEIN